MLILISRVDNCFLLNTKDGKEYKPFIPKKCYSMNLYAALTFIQLK